jgi:hypothetical protein
MEDISQWDTDCLTNEILPSVESVNIEKKAEGKFHLNASGKVDGDTTAELAKQVSGFANSGSGFIVYGITDDNKLDAGVPRLVGRQPIKDWVEAAIPKLVYPELTTCQAREIIVPGHHAKDRCVLVVQVPLSERRPHWTLSPTEVAYIRAGAHTFPMRPQSLLDISSRRGGSTADLALRHDDAPNRPNKICIFRVVPLIRLLNGHACESWGLDLRISRSNVRLPLVADTPDSPFLEVTNSQHFLISRPARLFPGRFTPAVLNPIEITWDQRELELPFDLEMTLYLDSGFTTTKTYSSDELLRARRGEVQ